jgi:hypothetical protein
MCKSNYGFFSNYSKPVFLNTVPVPGLENFFTGTWNIGETKNLSGITMKSSIFKDKVIGNIYYRDNWPQKY